MDLLTLIPVGSENAISRRELRIKSGLADRSMREEIEKLRHDGFPILNMQDGRGYFIPSGEDYTLVRAARKSNERRAKSVLQYNKFLKKWEEEHESV